MFAKAAVHVGVPLIDVSCVRAGARTAPVASDLWRIENTNDVHPSIRFHHADPCQLNASTNTTVQSTRLQASIPSSNGFLSTLLVYFP